MPGPERVLLRKHQATFGVLLRGRELAATLGRFTLQSQAIVLRADGFERPGATFYGGYVGALPAMWAQ